MDRREVYLRGLGLVLVAAALILFMSMLSYNPGDPPSPNWPANAAVANACGIVGAYVAHAFRFLIGTGAYLLILLTAIIGGLLVIARVVDDRLVRGIGAALALVSWCGLVSLLFPSGSMPAGPGGMIGHLISRTFLEPIGMGGYVLGALGIVLGALLAAEAWVLWVGRKGVEVLTMQGRPVGEATPPPAPPTPTPEPATNGTAATSTGDPRMAAQKELLRKRLEEQARQEQKAGSSKAGTETFPPQPPEKPAPVPPSEAPTLVVKDREKDKEKEPRKPPAPRKRAPQITGDYHLPGIDLLDAILPHDAKRSEEQVEQKRQLLERTLEEFGIAAQVVEVDHGPVITQYELELAPGVKITKIVSLEDDIARALKATSVRVVAPIPGKSTVGVEVPNATREIVQLRELMECGVLDRKRMTIPILLGKDASGEPLVSDLTQMPHFLIAGATGSGKSVCINTLIMTLLLTQSPDDVKLILVDPKMVELSAFKDIPHLMAPVVTDMKQAAGVLEWAARKMDERYSLMRNVGVRNIAGYNALNEKEIRKRLEAEEDDDLEGVPFRMPYIIIIIDELADLMLLAAKEVENTISRLTAKSRAVGIHVVVATQRPSVDVVTGLIKANLPSRLAFQTASKLDSRVILDRNGAEKLLGRGDMLFLPPGSAKLIRGQGCYTSDDEIRKVVSFTCERAKPTFDQELLRPQSIDGEDAIAEDPLFNDAARIIIESQRGSVSLLQRKLGIGYSRASRLVDLMAEAGIVGEYKGSQAREVMLSLEEWDAKHGGTQGGGAAGSEQDA